MANTKSSGPEKREPSRVELGEHERHVHFLLPHEEALVERQLEIFAAQQGEIGELLQEAVGQSSESTHDNAPRDVVLDAQGTIMAVARYTIQISRDKEIIDYPDPNDPKVAIGSRVTITTNGSEPFMVDILGFTPLEPTDDVESVKYTAPLGAALLGHEAGDQFTAEISEREMAIGVIAIDQLAIREQFTGHGSEV